ncbi:SH3 domain-containing protein [Sphingobium sp. CR2-8]|uniref:SH3 domain-containing protein n=1 Tax=Sphingobium sp. CR2-8 TaxID=1306534 RepID=UPI002DB8DB27|nr:SH3 domain-containing protein [Sphingobium sp. CR2-8]MEC3911703.1 SH3 domain-containing protein [Sphingobium sp. CR2-8]
MGDMGNGSGMKRWLLGAGMVAALGAAGAALAAPGKPVPYWASLSHDEARMRVGPSLDYPSNWVYRRRDLPVKVVQVLGLWRKVEDPDGAQGWMHVRLLSDTPTAIVRAPVAPLRESASDTARALFRAERGVVGRLSDCSGGWCAFDAKGQRGYVKASDVWGATDK